MKYDMVLCKEQYQLVKDLLPTVRHTRPCSPRKPTFAPKPTCLCAPSTTSSLNETHKDGNVLFNDALNTFYFTSKGSFICIIPQIDNTYHGLCYTSRGTLAATRNSSMDSPHEGSTRRPIAPWANVLTTEVHLAPETHKDGAHWTDLYRKQKSLRAVAIWVVLYYMSDAI